MSFKQKTTMGAIAPASKKIKISSDKEILESQQLAFQNEYYRKLWPRDVNKSLNPVEDVIGI